MKLITNDFETVPSGCPEDLPADIAPLEAPVYLAEKKAGDVLKKHPDSIIIGCDTAVICGSDILGKPQNKAQCREFMELLSGRTHQVVTGCCIMYKDTVNSFSVVTDVTFRRLDNDETEAYISSDEPYDKAGGYGIQGKGALLVEKISGDYFNVVGLPVSRLYQELKNIIKEKMI